MNVMNVWTIKEGEPLPIEGCPGRQMRCGIISEMLVERGHDVTWWTSDFFHQTKTRLREKEEVIEIKDNYRLHLLHARTTYKKNISWNRIRYSEQLGQEFKRASRLVAKPDIIYCSYPLIDFAYEAVKYANENNIPVIIDVRDMWPDIIWEHFNGFLSFLVKQFCWNMRKKTKYVMKNADMMICTIPKYLNLAKEYGRVLKNHDSVYYLAYKERQFSKQELEKAEIFFKNQGIKPSDFIVCYIGQINPRVKISMVADVISTIEECKFIICGDGTSKNELETKYKQFSNIMFLGFLDQVYLETLMTYSSIGVIPFLITSDFVDTINNKLVEYMMGSLCVATNLCGLQRNIIDKNNIGFYFENQEDFMRSLLEMMNNPRELMVKKKNARNFYELNFRSDIVYGKLCDIIEKL